MNTNTNAGMTALTPEYFAQRWSDPQSLPLIKGRLIDETGCCCAQGDVLRCAGFADQQLRSMTQTTADREVARLLGITIAEAVLIRVVNDSTGCPQDVFKAPERVLGPHHRLWTAFARHIDQMSKEDWERVASARATAGAAAGAAAWVAAGYAARDAAEAAAWVKAGDVARDAVGAAAWVATGDAARDAVGAAAREEAWVAAPYASDEVVGWSRLEEPFFLKMFFDDPWEWVRSIEEADSGQHDTDKGKKE